MEDHLRGDALKKQMLDQIDAIIQASEERSRPLEVDPARNDLFELFVKAEQAGCVGEDAVPDLSADGICQSLAERWGLKSSAESWVSSEQKIPAEHIAKMRSLWSVMRMWMEWTYAWQRWAEFHDTDTAQA